MTTVWHSIQGNPERELLALTVECRSCNAMIGEMCIDIPGTLDQRDAHFVRVLDSSRQPPTHPPRA